MCGIAGIYFKNGNPDELKEAVKKMIQCQSRRGPDDEGIFQSEFAVLGHRRLSILDLSKAGRQPMEWQSVNREARIAITYNGEIYNFLELKKELEKKGRQFQTKTDTEVILALYAEYGEKSFIMLRGMFAFGLYDAGRRKFFLVKDRYGVKPLYYCSDKEKLIFASTVKAIIGSGLAAAEKNPEAFIGFLLFGSVPLPMTTSKNIFAVPAGHYLVREADGGQRLIKYYEPLGFFNTRISDDPKLDIIQNIRNLLEDSVKHHLISDAPLGVFLSGGLDSSALAALAAKSLENRRLVTLSIIFDEKEFSEEYYSDLAAEKINSDHRKIKITERDFYDSFEDLFEAMDQPTIDGVNTFFIAKAARQAGLKTVLSGLGADEIFLGYPHFQRAALLKNIHKAISIFGHHKSLKFMMSRILNLLGGRYSKLSYFLNGDILSFYLGVRGLFAPQEAAKILDVNLSEVENFMKNLILGISGVPNIDINIRTSEVQKLNPVDLLSYLELKFYLQNQLLKDADFMSMRHSVEVRVPFLDHQLVEYVSGLPSDLKLKNSKAKEFKNINKPLLSAAVKDLLPQEIFARPKMGFTFPFQKWFRQRQIARRQSRSVQKEKSAFGDSRLAKSHWSRFWAETVLSKFRNI